MWCAFPECEFNFFYNLTRNMYSKNVYQGIRILIIRIQYIYIYTSYVGTESRGETQYCIILKYVSMDKNVSFKRYLPVISPAFQLDKQWYNLINRDMNKFWLPNTDDKCWWLHLLSNSDIKSRLNTLIVI